MTIRRRARDVRPGHRRRPGPVEPLEPRRLLAGQIYVGDAGTGTVGVYDPTGGTVNASLISGLNYSGPYGDIAVSGGYLYILNSFAGTVGQYGIDGSTVNANLITGLTSNIPFGMTINGSNLYVVFGNGGSTSPDGHVDQYTLGATPGTIASSVPNLITGVADADSVLVDGSTIYVSDYALGTIGSYGLDGSPINPSLITGLTNPEAMVQAGSELFVTEQGANQRVGAYALDGTPVNANLITGLGGPYKIGESGGNLFVSSGTVIGEYTTTGAVVNASLITGLSSPFAVAFAADVSSAAQLGLATQPTSGTATVPLAGVTADVNDAAGALVSADGSTATLSIATGPAGATLSGTTTAVANGGVATFGNIAVSLPGTYTFTVTDGALTAVTTAPFTVVAPAIRTVGQLDPTFGTGGLASHDVGFTSTTGVAADGAQSVLVGPIGAAPSAAFGVTRYNADGSLDTSFGTAGVVDTPFAAASAVPSAVAVLANGDLLVAGTVTSSAADGSVAGSEFAVAEYLASGALNAAFGNSGTLEFEFGTALSTDVLNALATGPGGAIYLAGTSNAAGAGNADLALARLTPAGALDATFNGKGTVTTDVAGGDDAINGIAVQSNGAVVVAGSATVGGVSEVALARYLATGALDKRFGAKGITTSKVGGVYDSASSVAITGKGQIVVGGLTASGAGAAPTSDFLVQRYTTGGKPDRSFGTGGTTVTSFGQPAAVTQVALQSDGFLVASGRTSATLGGTLDLAVARYTLRGVADAAFNGTGKVAVSLTAGVTATPARLRAAISSSLGAAFDAFTTSSQGVVAVTAGGAILSAGNSGTDTVEAQLVAAGVDLVAKVLSSLPAAVLAGAKGTATVTVTEGGTTRAAGSVTISVSFAVDAAGTGAVVAGKGLTTKVNLNQGQSKTYKLPFAYPASATSGGYYMLATVTDGAGLSADLNAYNNVAASPAAVAVAPAFVALAGSALATTAITAGRSATVSLNLINDGNVTAKGKIDVVLYLSTDTTVAGGTQVGSAPVTVGLSAGKAHPYRLRFTAPALLASGTFHLLAVVDPADSLTPADRGDVLVVDASPVVIP